MNLYATNEANRRKIMLMINGPLLSFLTPGAIDSESPLVLLVTAPSVSPLLLELLGFTSSGAFSATPATITLPLSSTSVSSVALGSTVLSIESTGAVVSVVLVATLSLAVFVVVVVVVVVAIELGSVACAGAVVATAVATVVGTVVAAVVSCGVAVAPGVFPAPGLAGRLPPGC